MSDARDFDVRDEDRLPWLDTVEPAQERGGSDVLRTLLLVLGGLVVIAAIVFGLYKLQSSTPTGGQGELIAAQEGDYKIKPDDPGGLKVEGEGDAAVAASGGGSTNGAIDLRAVPEAPITATRPAPAASSDTGGTSASAVVPSAAKPLTAKPPMTPPPPRVAGAASGGSLVQLGAFPNEAGANSAWSAIARRFTYVAPLGKSVQAANVGGRTVYRLRVNAGSANAAAELCGRLKSEGENCFVTN